jgi:hypothetical protein
VNHEAGRLSERRPVSTVRARSERQTMTVRQPHSGSVPASKATWDDDIERLFEAWLRRVAAAEAGHREDSARLRRGSLLLGVPVVVLTTVVGTSVFASLQNGHVPSGLRIFIGSISILAAVLSSLQTFLRFGMRAEGHRIAAFRYETLRRDMTQVLALPRGSRPDAVHQLDSVRQRLDRYAKESPTIDERRWAKLERQFHLSRVPPDPQWDRRIRIPDSAAGAADDATAKGATRGL